MLLLYLMYTIKQQKAELHLVTQLIIQLLLLLLLQVNVATPLQANPVIMMVHVIVTLLPVSMLVIMLEQLLLVLVMLLLVLQLMEIIVNVIQKWVQKLMEAMVANVNLPLLIPIPTYNVLVLLQVKYGMELLPVELLLPVMIMFQMVISVLQLVLQLN